MTTINQSVSEKIWVNIGGERQGMFIKGSSAKNPVILFLHGGPGMPEYFLAEKYFNGLEEIFTVCYWEQRGAGISYRKGMEPESITTERLVEDAIEVTDYLRKRFGQSKIYLMAHSWGTFIGIQAAARAPELFHAYIGIGQVTNQLASERLAYSYMLKQYTAAGNNKTAGKLKAYAVLESDAALRSFFVSMLRDDTMHELGIGTMRNMKSVVSGIFLPVLKCGAYTIKERINIWRAKAFLRSRTSLLGELFSTDINELVAALELPAYFISGAYDLTVNVDLSKAYYEQLQAPVKAFYTFEQSAHSPMFEEPQRFAGIMAEDVLNTAALLADAE